METIRKTLFSSDILKITIYQDYFLPATGFGLTKQKMRKIGGPKVFKELTQDEFDDYFDDCICGHAFDLSRTLDEELLEEKIRNEAVKFRLTVEKKCPKLFENFFRWDK
jgi:hypothetical protein